MNPTEINIEEANKFLRLLDPATEEFTYQVFDDDKSRKNPALAAIRHGTLARHGDFLKRASKAGCGVFVTVNQTDGNGRKSANITGIRAVWHEQDWTGDIDFPLEPSIVVESSPGKFHRYWLAEGMTKEQHQAIMNVMVGQYDSDKQVKDIARVMRLPGFPHLKDPSNPFIVRIVSSPGHIYPAQALIDAFPAIVSALTLDPLTPATPRPAIASGEDIISRVEKIAIDAAFRTVDDMFLGRHGEIVKIGHYMRRDGFPLNEDTLNAALNAFARYMRQTDTSGAFCPIDWQQETKALRDGYQNQTSPDILPTRDERAEIAAMTGRKVADRILNPPAQEPENTPEPKTFVMPCPVAGFDELAEIIGRRASLLHKDAAEAAAISVICACASRKYIGSNGTPAHLYLGAVSRSIGTLGYLHSGANDIMKAAGLRRMVRTQRIGAPNHVNRLLMRNPATLYLCQEWGGMLQFARRQPSGQLEQALQIMSGLYSESYYQIDSVEESGMRAVEGDDQPIIYSPSLSIFALLSNDQMSTFARISEIGRGAMENFMLVLFDENDARLQEPDSSTETPQWLISRLQKMRGLDEAIKTLAGDFSLAALCATTGAMEPEMTIIRMPSTAEYDSRIMRMSQNLALRPVLLGRRATMQRICIGIAAFSNPENPVITKEIMEWACHWVCRHTQKLLDMFSMIVSEDGKTSAYQKIMQHITDSGRNGISHKDLKNSCHAYKALGQEKRRDLIALLIDDEEIHEVMFGKVKVFQAKRLAKKAKGGDGHIPHFTPPSSPPQATAGAGYSEGGDGGMLHFQTSI